MSDFVFDYPPSIELLQWLAKLSLRQTDVLPMAIRLWVILRSLYGNSDDPVYLEGLNNCFGYSEWRDLFFLDIDSHHQRDRVALLHNPNCPCSKTITDWLFDPETGIPQHQWQEDFTQHYSPSAAEMDRALNPTNWLYDPNRGCTEAQWRQALQQRYQLSEGELKTLTRVVQHPERERHRNRPFAVSRKTLKKDLKTLVSLGWLSAEGYRYRKVAEFPPVAISNQTVVLAPFDFGVAGQFIQSDLADFVDKFASPINGVRRFFLQVEYIIPGQLYSHIEQLQNQLKRLWSQTPVPPVRLVYRSAKLYQDEVERVVYPVCICYFQRAPYLFAYGQTPSDESQLNWYDYRLDRIQGLQLLSWDAPDIPPPLRSWEKKPIPPEKISEWMSEALGFEFYKPKESMLLRFDRYFYANYIAGTERDTLFEKLSHRQALSTARTAALSSGNRRMLEAILQSRSPQDIYCRVHYRAGDNNAIMRLRAWGQNVEVLLPWDLRQRMRSDLVESSRWYQ
ncbi:TIGR03985 family CRISPR-associated protein [Lusitaniella coriacea LEGE 07157]|uniref:TIGR03985 family CRISPR-associated protein n=1 Tax=Lusitaniella coriacea LEGE 07157 TaxID=945747 RepID=A0A8J7ARQ7_9CYAN|nr:TIGR03985 family CRISPR-associated protein [Lusitaniella coriacea]MBE9114941.1 TIGR03985 family CRISPR-associated protein [Lusitaniella coriacea LEGE 07157]